MIQIDPADPTPIYVQIANGIKAQIASGRLARGDTLPSLRDLAQDLGINLNTVKAAYSLLEQLSLVHLRRGRRARVCAPSPSDERQRTLRLAMDRLFVEARLAGLSRKGFMRLCSETARRQLK